MRFRPFKILFWGLVTLAALLVAGVTLTPNIEISSWRMMLNAAGPQASTDSVSRRLVAPAGFALSLYAGDVPKARFLRATSAGDLLVSQPRLGQILLLTRDADGDGQPDGRQILVDGLDRPQGMDIADGWLYIAESGALGRIAFDSETGLTSGEYRQVLGGIPAGGNHWGRTVRIGPDGWLYLTIGSSCNACIEKHEWRAVMLRLRPDGSQVQIHASGLRNSVGFDWAPWNGELYATDNGRDLLGDDFPPCELNHIVAGGFYGWPYINGFGKLDPDNGKGKEGLLDTALSPVHGFRAHNAPLGITFLRNPSRVPRLQRAALVALHGSWNRSIPDGYKVVLLRWDEQGLISESDFLSGFERDGDVIGRPVDVVEAADGNIFVSDDYAGAIYRLVPGEDANTLAISAVPATVAARPDPLAGIEAQQIAAANISADALMKRHACLGCHLAGTVPGDKLRTLAERYTLDELSDYFLLPTAPMPIFPLSADERRALAIHLLSSAKD
ncbi:MAG: PQQ-dependent sugar dehydrogenase [Pseudomonadales bacterium]|nr:PQQ-dependent sugar dehydrogenase [Pseudomonadales bacterium]